MSDHFIDFMQKFTDRRLLKKKVVLQFRADVDHPRVFCDEPVVVARFASELRQAAIRNLGIGTRVLIRGQTANHPGMVPGLFRPPTDSFDPPRLAGAEVAFEKAIRKRIKLGRFMRPNLTGLLQHYGYRTSWLDVVDNLWTAVWFATHMLVPKDGQTRSAAVSNAASGWLYFLAVQVESTGCSAIDLRESHHGLSLRPHAQSGWSVRGCPSALSDLNRFVIACVEFPNQDRWKMVGHMASAAFLFPPPGLDDTLRRIERNNMDAIAECVERDHSLPNNALGRSFRVNDDAA